MMWVLLNHHLVLLQNFSRHLLLLQLLDGFQFLEHTNTSLTS